MNNQFLKYSTLIIAVVSILLTSAVAQKLNYSPGYIITLKRDTLFGHCKSLNNIHSGQFVKFINLVGKKKKYYAGEILGYSREGEYFESKKVVPNFTVYLKENIFMKRVEKGPVNLFQCTYASKGLPILDREGRELTKGYSVNTDYYLEKPTGENLWVIRYAFSVTVGKFLKDYPKLAQLVVNEEYVYENLQQIVQIYNDWWKRGRPVE